MSRRQDWPQEIRKPHVYGNFRPSREERRSQRSSDYLANIRQVACLTCPENRGIHAHHLRYVDGPRRAAGTKPADWLAVPLCGKCHMDVHREGSRGERRWYWQRGIDIEELRKALWDARADVEWMRKVRDDAARQAIRTLSARLREARAVDALIKRGLTRREAEEQYEDMRRAR